MKFVRALVPLVAAALSLSGGPAGAGVDDQGASSAPQTQGPVSLDSSQCSEQAVRSDSGTFLGTAETCIYLYSFDTLSELDALHEYRAAWLQGRFVPASGWCATNVSTDLHVSGGADEGISKNTPVGKKTETKLTMDAGGMALEDGRISQTFTPAPGSIEITSEAGKPNVRGRWKGKTGRAVTLLSGVAYSYALLDGAPDKVNFGFTGFSLVSC